MNNTISKIKGIAVALALMLLYCGTAYAGDPVRGCVVDGSGHPIVGAIITSGEVATLTDAEGLFSIAASAEVKAEMPGFKLTSMPVSSPYLTVVMQEEKEDALPKELVTRFGLASAVYTIKGSELEDGYTSNIGKMLSGRLPGLTVMQNTGEPGKEDPTLYVRGQGSFNGSAPKIYVDGFEAPMTNLDPREIETISVLKDAGALSQLGINGANGAIWVTTKRGVQGRPKAKISLEAGLQEAVTLPQFANSYQYASLYNEALSNDAGAWTMHYTQQQLDAYKKGNDGTIENYDLLYPNVNWYDAVLKPFAPMTNLNATFTGGGKAVTYYLQLGYQNIDGLYDGADRKRKVSSNINQQKFNFRTNIDARLSKIFSVKTSIGGNIIDRYNPAYSTDNMWSNMMTYPANAYPVRTPKGYGGTALYPDNPKGTVTETGFRQYHYRNIQATVTLFEDLDFITKGLRLYETVSIYNNQSQTYLKQKNYQRFSPYEGADGIEYNVIGTADTDFTITQTGNSYNNFTNRINTQIGADYARQFGNHSVSAWVAYQGDKYHIAGTKVPVLTRGFMGRVNYDYLKRYIAEFSFAYNGMSPYNPEKNMGFFPSLSLGWIASNEGFLKDSNTIDFLKVRASAGLTGMADLSTATNYFMYQQYYKSGNTTPNFGWEGTSKLGMIYEYYIANPDASWEKGFKSNFGFDLVMLNNRLSVSADIFYDYRYDILTQLDVFAYTGILSDMNYNFGRVSNKGVEISASWTDKAGDFSYYINPTFSFARNKILEMNEEPKAYDFQRQTGTSIGTYNYLRANGLINSWDEINDPSSPIYRFTSVQPGDIRYVDRSGDGFIDANDKEYLTDYYTNVPEINYGIRIGMAWKGFDLDIYGYGMANRTINIKNILNSAYQDGTGNLSLWALDRWAYYPDQGIDTRDTATYPRLSAGTNANNWGNNSTFWLRNGNFFRLSNVTLGYTLPNRLTSKIGIDKIRVYLTGTNLFTIDHIDIGDVESQLGYPLMRTYKIGLNINF